MKAKKQAAPKECATQKEENTTVTAWEGGTTVAPFDIKYVNIGRHFCELCHRMAEKRNKGVCPGKCRIKKRALSRPLKGRVIMQ